MPHLALNCVFRLVLPAECVLCCMTDIACDIPARTSNDTPCWSPSCHQAIRELQAVDVFPGPLKSAGAGSMATRSATGRCCQGRLRESG